MISGYKGGVAGDGWSLRPSVPFATLRLHDPPGDAGQRGKSGRKQTVRFDPVAFMSRRSMNIRKSD
jgi:hypothetical protein